jgi:aryl-alcohol dehydrogenase-like predicted oxidoreductase
MQQRKFGRTGLQVSELGLGAMQFGWLTNQENSHAILDAYWAAGGNFIQTTTGDALGLAACHRSEEIVGAWLRERRIPRDRLVLSTRVACQRPPEEGRAGLATTLRQQCEESLRRLGVNHLDLLVLEWQAAPTAVDDVFRALDDLMRAGKLRYVGAAGFPLWRFMEALGRSARLGSCRFESFQADYSLAERGTFEPDAFDLAQEHRVALVAQSPLAGGFLTGFFHAPGQPDSARTRRLRERYGNHRGHAVLESLQGIAAETGRTPSQVALAWLLARPVSVLPLLGVATPDQLREAVGATRLTLTTAQVERLTATAHRVPGLLEFNPQPELA